MIVRALVIGLAVAIAGVDAFGMWLQFQNSRNYPVIDFEPEQQIHIEPPQSACWSNDRNWIEANCYQFGRAI